MPPHHSLCAQRGGFESDYQPESYRVRSNALPGDGECTRFDDSTDYSGI